MFVGVYAQLAPMRDALPRLSGQLQKLPPLGGRPAIDPSNVSRETIDPPGESMQLTDQYVIGKDRSMARVDEMYELDNKCLN